MIIYSRNDLIWLSSSSEIKRSAKSFRVCLSDSFSLKCSPSLIETSSLWDQSLATLRLLKVALYLGKPLILTTAVIRSSPLLFFLLMKLATSLSLSSESLILKSTRSLKTKTIHLAMVDSIYLILFINLNSHKSL